MKLKDYLSWSMTPARAKKWQKTREKGKTRFVFLIGVLWWGGFMTIFMSLYQYLTRPERFDWIQNPAINLVCYAIGGFLFGVFTWGMTERQYLKFKEKNLKTEQGTAHGTPKARSGE